LPPVQVGSELTGYDVVFRYPDIPNEADEVSALLAPPGES
jgi:hypothetical protein